MAGEGMPASPGRNSLSSAAAPLASLAPSFGSPRQRITRGRERRTGAAAASAVSPKASAAVSPRASAASPRQRGAEGRGRGGAGDRRGNDGDKSRPQGKATKKPDFDEADDFSDEGLVAKAKWTVRRGRDLKMLVGSRRLRPKDVRFGRPIGVGTFALIRLVELRGLDGEDSAPMALKTMKKMQLVMTNQIGHVKEERHLLHTLNSPFIVTLLSSFQDDRRVFLLLELVHGGDMFNLLRREGRLQVPNAKFYIAELVLALSHIHSFSIVYRDLKPENVMIDWQGHIKLTDFGFAKELGPGEIAYTMVGTPEYLAPEILQCMGHDCSVDFWALGVLTFEMLAGYPPFLDSSPFKVYSKILAHRINYPRHFDYKAVDLMQNLMTPDVSKRYDHFQCMAHVWFDRVPWRELEAQTAASPWIPRLRDPFDMRYFEEVPEDKVNDSFDESQAVTAKMKLLFKGAF